MKLPAPFSNIASLHFQELTYRLAHQSLANQISSESVSPFCFYATPLLYRLLCIIFFYQSLAFQSFLPNKNERSSGIMQYRSSAIIEQQCENTCPTARSGSDAYLDGNGEVLLFGKKNIFCFGEESSQGLRGFCSEIFPFKCESGPAEFGCLDWGSCKLQRVAWQLPTHCSAKLSPKFCYTIYC